MTAASDWIWTTLGDLCSGGGLLQTGPFGSQLHADEYTAAGVAVLMPQDIGANAEILATHLRFVSPETAERLGKHRLALGDIVYSRRGDVEKRAYVKDADLPALCGTGCLLVRPNSSVDSRFLAFRLGRADTRSWLRQHAVGATMPNLNTQILSEVPVSLPGLPEQQAIAEVLGALDDKIAANQRLCELADELASALTTRETTNGASLPLGNLAEIGMGSSPSGTSYNDSGRGAVLYQGNRDFGMRFPKPRVWTDSPTRMAEQNDILMSVRAPVGQVNIAPAPCCIGRGLASLRCPWPHALFHLLRLSSPALDAFNGEGTIFGSITRNQLEVLPIRVPEAGLDALEASISPLEECIGAALRESQTLAELRDTLLPALMDGTIRVKDAVQKAEEVL